MVLSQANQDFDEGAVLNIQEELDETERSLKEVTLMIEQSQDEVGKLTQRNAAITAHLQQIQSDIATMPAEEVRMAYDSALDAQQRLLVMRGQLDKLQNDKTHLDRYKAVLKQTNGSATQDNAQVSGGKRSELSNIEMVLFKRCVILFLSFAQ